MYGEAPKELYLSREQKVKKMSEIDSNEETDKRSYIDGFKDGAEFGYNKAFVEADKNLKAIVTDFNKANEWHKADIPTSQINKVVLGYIKDYNSKMFCLVKWNGEWWYDARTYNERVKLIAWKEIVLPKEI